MRRLMALMAMMVALVAPALAQDADPAPWQETVTAQIEAFRAQDGAAALSLAGQQFRSQFDGQPEAFYAAIVLSGYQPIAVSRSHSFGEFNAVSDTSVLQVVKFVGPDQELHEALYQLADEPDEGWRVQGVALRRTPGIGI
ncbi:MAG TPA: DUF4864 domain-containing protein [Devosia sp.]|nr:DUF4864 domain-containing protein [Devosia sp.]